METARAHRDRLLSEYRQFASHPKGTAASRKALVECGEGLARSDRAERRRACLTALETLRPGVAQTAHAISFGHARLSAVLRCFGLLFAGPWAWLLLSPGTAWRNLQ